MVALWVRVAVKTYNSRIQVRLGRRSREWTPREGRREARNALASWYAERSFWSKAALVGTFYFGWDAVASLARHDVVLPIVYGMIAVVLVTLAVVFVKDRRPVRSYRLDRAAEREEQERLERERRRIS